MAAPPDAPTVLATVQAALARARVTEPLAAWAHLDVDGAAVRARALDAGLEATQAAAGVLHGLPVGIKDLIDTADQPTEYGSPAYRGHRPAHDAEVVRRLRAAGAVVLGKTVTTEHALFHPGPTRNPHDPLRSPGGSSSGSAAAVAAGVVPVALGTQTAGSVLRPASFSGVVGTKPSFGVVPTAGIKPCAPSLDTVGVLAADAGLAAAVLGVLADDPERFRPWVPDRPLRVGFCRTPWWSALEPGAGAAIEAGVRRLAGGVASGGGLEVVEVVAPESFGALAGAQEALMAAEVLEALADEVPDTLSDTLRAYLQRAAQLAPGAPEAAALAERWRARLPELFAGVDVLLVPAALGEAPLLSAGSTGDPLPCRAFTLLGVPTVSVPGLLGPAGLPLGVQLVAPYGQDGLALGAATSIGAALAG